MKTTAEYLDAIKARHHLPSDYAVAKMLGITRAAVSRYRNNEGTFDDPVSIRAAELLDLDPEEVILSGYVARAKDDRVRAALARLARRAGYAGSVAYASIAALSPDVAHAAFCIMSTSDRRRPLHRPPPGWHNPARRSTDKPRNAAFFPPTDL